MNAQQASTSHHVNAQSAANPSMTDADTLARAFTQHASMTGGASHNVSQRMALAVAKSEKPKWDTQKEPFHTLKRRVMIWVGSLKIEHLLIDPPLGDVAEFECHDAARRIVLLSLSAADTDCTADTTHLYEAWNLLLDHHEPSRAVCCDTRQCRCGYQCTGYSLMHGSSPFVCVCSHASRYIL